MSEVYGLLAGLWRLSRLVHGCGQTSEQRLKLLDCDGLPTDSEEQELTTSAELKSTSYRFRHRTHKTYAVAHPAYDSSHLPTTQGGTEFETTMPLARSTEDPLDPLVDES